MAQFRFIGDKARQVSMLPAGTLQLVEPDEMFDVPEAVADSYECQPDLYERLDEPPPVVDERTDTEREADEQAAAARAENERD
jgi:hypothetical protein